MFVNKPKRLNECARIVTPSKRDLFARFGQRYPNAKPDYQSDNPDTIGDTTMTESKNQAHKRVNDNVAKATQDCLDSYTSKHGKERIDLNQF